MATGIVVPSDIDTKYREAKNRWDEVLGERAESRFCNLSIETGTAFYVEVFVLIFVDKLEIFTYASCLFCLVEFKFSNPCLNIPST